MRSLVEARRSVESDRDSVTAMWAAAFTTDPVIRWFLPDDATYQAKAEAVFGFIFDVRHVGGEVWVAPQRSAAAWTPPGGLRPMSPSPSELWADLAATVSEEELERMDAYGSALSPLLPTFDNWYLGAVGTAPAFHGQGFGQSVVRPILDRGDAGGVPQSLETCVPANRDLYRRWGFEVTGEFSVAGSPVAWVMVRQPEA